ncbi:MAG: TolC family protein [Pirellulaceae bacterium]|nr:TolC family protein [Pirellulaceae bacterium]
MHTTRFIIRLSAIASIVVGGCQFNARSTRFKSTPMSEVPANITQLRPSDAVPTANMPTYVEPSSPLDCNESNLTPDKFRAMSLQECISQSLSTSPVMRDLGVTIVRAPQSIGTNLDPALTFSDPRLGEEAALSAFDANVFASSFFESNDRQLNNKFFGQQGQFVQDLSTSQFGINKRSATGGLYTIRQVAVYDRNNQPSNTFADHSWDSYLEAQIRQPLLQGAGTQFNRIAGPGATPGQLNGVLLARVRTDISLIDFQRSVRDFVSEIENAYWDLYYAYRDLEARVSVREIAEETLQSLPEADTSDGKRAQAQEQVHRLQSEVIDSLNGRPIDATRTNNGSTGGTFRGTGGIRVCERRLRLMIGLPINDGTLLRPSELPVVAPVVFDWNSAVCEAINLREELRRQRWVIKQRELELLANRNFLRPQLDVVGQYRMRGFGNDLDDASKSLYNGQFQEWQFGLDYSMPAGFRRASSAVRNSQFALARESEILREQERAIHYGLSNAINETKRSYENWVLQEKRLQSIVTQLNAIDAKETAGEKAELDVRLETHRRLLDARLRFHQAEVEYMLALRNVNVERGTLLRYCSVWMNEAESPDDAAIDAVRRISAQDYQTIPVSRDMIVGFPAQ